MSIPSYLFFSTTATISFICAARSFGSRRMRSILAVSLHMIVGTTRTSSLYAAFRSFFQVELFIFPRSWMVPSFFTEYTNGLISVSWSRCFCASRAPSLAFQYGIQPEYSSEVVAACAGTAVPSRSANTTGRMMIFFMKSRYQSNERSIPI